MSRPGRTLLLFFLVVLFTLPAELAEAQRRDRRFDRNPNRGPRPTTEGPLFAPTVGGLPGIHYLPSAALFEGTTIGISVSGTVFSEDNFDGLGNKATGGNGTIALGYTFNSKIAFGLWLSALGLNSPSALPAPLQSGNSGFQFLFLPYAVEQGFFRGVGVRTGVRATSGRVVVDAWLPTASPYGDVIFTMQGGPVIIDVSGGFLLDRSEGLLEPGLIPDLPPNNVDLDASRRHVYGVSSGSQVRWGLGLQAPLARNTVRPFLEYRGTQFLDGASGDSPQVVSGGIRFSFPLIGRLFSLTAGANAALAGTATAPLRPREPKIRGFFQLAVSAPPYKVTTVVEEVRLPPPPPPPAPKCPELGNIRGAVRDAESGEPLENAIVSFLTGDEQGRNDLLTNKFGRFMAPAFKPGEVTVTISAEGYEVHTQEVMVKNDATEEIEVQLAGGDPTTGTLRGSIRSRTGDPLAASLKVIQGETTIKEITADEAGTFEVEVPAGNYSVSVEADGFQPKAKDVELATGQLLILNLLLSEVE